MSTYVSDRISALGFVPSRRHTLSGGALRRQSSLDRDDDAESPTRSELAVRVAVRCRPPCKPGDSVAEFNCEGAGRDKVTLKLDVPCEDGGEKPRLSDSTPGSARSRHVGTRSFRCNNYLGLDCTQEDVFDIAAPVVERTMEGYNGTIFCYGVTGSGKTYTMSGPPEDIGIRQRDPASVGIVQRVSRRIFEYIRDRSSKGEVFVVEASFLEIYSADGQREQLIDLLSDDERKLEVKQDPLNRSSFVCEGLKRVGIRSPDEMREALYKGQQRCTFMETSKNCSSSRSHCLFMLTVECLIEQPGAGEPIVQRGKLMLVDLAGSESIKKVQAANDVDEDLRKKQAIGINRVLSSLGTVVNNMNIGLAGGYRDSALTMLLRDCLGGNSRALLIACIGPELDTCDETAKTLNFAQQMMAVRNVAIVNRVDQEHSALLSMRQRHLDCIRILQEKTNDARDEESEERKRIQKEMEDLNTRLLTKDSAEETLKGMRDEQFQKIDEMREEMTKAMTAELAKMREKSFQDLENLKQSVERHVTNLDDTHHQRHTEEHQVHITKMQAELQEALRSQKAIDEEAAGLRIRLAAAEERAKMLQARQEEVRKERAFFDEERRSLRQQSEQQWQKLTSVEGDLQKFKAEAEVRRSELGKLNGKRAEDAEAARRERDSWRLMEQDLQHEIATLHQNLEQAKRDTDVQALTVEGQRREACTQLRLQIERLEIEAAQRSEQLNSARQLQAELEAEREDAKLREQDLRQIGAMELKQCQDELDEAKQREQELMAMLHEIQDGIIAASTSGVG